MKRIDTRIGAIGKLQKNAAKEGVKALWKAVGCYGQGRGLTASQLATYDGFLYPQSLAAELFEISGIVERAEVHKFISDGKDETSLPSEVWSGSAFAGKEQDQSSLQQAS
ncbi:hypothetical protein Tco_0506294 [Tanacetum coccineum]